MYRGADRQPESAVRNVGVLLGLRGVCVFPFEERLFVENGLLLGRCHELVVRVLDVLGGSRHARGFMLDRGLHSFRAFPLGRAFTAYGSFSALLPRFMTAYGSLLIPEEPQGFAAYSFFSAKVQASRSDSASTVLGGSDVELYSTSRPTYP